jgi:glycosyltransferase involved in cell wall biosynthesis
MFFGGPMKISVVVPVRNEEKTIRGLVENLLAQSRVPDEIVITDGGSNDSTRSIISEYISSGAPIKLIESDDALPGRGRNLAASAAQFDWLAFIDAGILPEHDWLDRLMTRAEANAKIDVVYGSWTPITDSFFKECAAIAYVPPAVLTHGSYQRPRSIASTLLRKSVWQAVGGFPEHLRSGEDLVFMNHIERRGFETVFEPQAMVHWEIKPSLGSTFSRFVTYSRNNIRAGLWRQWQKTILTRYACLFLLSVPALVFGKRWLFLPLIAWVGMLLARAFVAIRRNRFSYPATLGRNLERMLALTAVIAVLDAAALIGTLEWLLKDSFRQNPRTVVEADDGA